MGLRTRSGKGDQSLEIVARWKFMSVRASNGLLTLNGWPFRASPSQDSSVHALIKYFKTRMGQVDIVLVPDYLALMHGYTLSSVMTLEKEVFDLLMN